MLTVVSFLCSPFLMLSTKCYYNRAHFIKRWPAGQQLRTPSYALPSQLLTFWSRPCTVFTVLSGLSKAQVSIAMA